jgi:sec-independent protein translocase protein TatC
MAKLADTITGARVLGTRIAATRKRQNPEGRMPLMDHIRELRNRVLKSLAVFVVAFAAALIPQVHNPIWAFIYHPFQVAHFRGAQLSVIGVLDPFSIWIQIAFWFALVVTCPVWLYQLWAFISPGLYAREKRYTYVFMAAAVPLFLGGAFMAYFVMSRGLKYLLRMAPGGITIIPTVSNYLSYFQAMLLGFGLAFELPLALVMANRIGILSHQRMAKWRRIIIFAVFVFAGIASPSPDPVTMLLLALPCVALIELAELLIWANDRRRARIPSPYAGLSDDEASPLNLDLADPADTEQSSGPSA